jgi:uracil-DNA glycosylase family 4
VSTERELADHLRYYAELGVEGLSRDPGWRRRSDVTVSRPDEPPASVDEAVDAAGTAISASGQRTLEEVRTELGDCTRCKLHHGRTNLVFGVGSPTANLMFVGEGPGADEDAQGEPFVGRAGQLLTQIIKAMGYQREQVYIANVVKCRPPNNRNPEPDEVETCQPFLLAQIDVIQPTVIVALGKFAAQTLLRTETPISRLRGRFHTVRGVEVMPTFHPSYLLRNPAAKREVWDDMKQVMRRLTRDD